MPERHHGVQPSSFEEPCELLFTPAEYQRLVTAIIRGHPPGGVDQETLIACLEALELLRCGQILLSVTLKGKADVCGLDEHGELVFTARR